MRTADGRVAALRGPTSEPTPLADAAWPTPVTSEVAPGTVCLVRRGDALPLWPLCLYGEPRPAAGEPSGLGEAPQVYSRRGEVRLEYTPLGVEGASEAVGDEAGLAAFQRLFQLERFQGEAQVAAFAIRGFEREFRKDAHRLVGRVEEVETLAAALAAAPDGVLWVSGPAGIGKSFVVARVLGDLLEAQPAPSRAPRRMDRLRRRPTPRCQGAWRRPRRR